MRADPRTDCNDNGVLDECELTTETDCNANGVLDVCELTSDTDCNANGILDECELTSETDCNGNGVLDECDLATTLSFTADLADLCEDAGFVQPGVIYMGSTTGQGAEGNESCNYSQGAPDVYYKYRPSAGGQLS